MTFYFDTKPEWIEALRSWAASDPLISRVWLFGSRVNGKRQYEVDGGEVPDLDVAYSLSGGKPGELLAHAICQHDRWLRQLAAIPVNVDLQLADPDDLVVMPAVRDHGVLIYQRSTVG